MTNLKTQNINDIIEIGKNHIKYYNEILKISNISRTWIFRFQNIEKRNYEKAVQAYEKDKERYEEIQTQKKNESIKNNLIAAVVFLFILIFGFSLRSIAIVILSLCFLGIFAYRTYLSYNTNIVYPESPPVKRPFPDKFGLGIEMNSGYIATFTAIGDDGEIALRRLQNDIDSADIHSAPTIFNMNDYKITVENNEGIISTGEKSKNNLYGVG